MQKMEPPKYNISQFLPAQISEHEGQRPIDLVLKLLPLVEIDGHRYRKDSELLHPENVIKDVIYFETAMGSGFSNVLNYADGMEMFTRALLAFPEIEAPKQTSLLFQARDIANKHGVFFPSTVPDSWGENSEVSYELCEKIDVETSSLDEQYWSTSGDSENDIYLAVLRYLESHADKLQVRNQPSA